MSKTSAKFYVTTPIYYVTAKPHLGHLYSTVIADVLARWHKLMHKKVHFLTGTDEFGQKIAQAAQKAGKNPQEFVDSFIDAYKNVWKVFNIEYDVFMRTTNDFHIKAVQHWITRLMDQGDIYKSFYEGWYCVPDETFVTEYEVGTKAPNCPSCGRETIKVSEEAYFFKLSSYQDRLLEFYEKHPDFIIPNERSQEVINFVKSGLKDLSISRTTVSWGVPFPGNDKHVTYVWADALNNYITAIGWGQPQREKEFTQWWPADVQVMGKDIVRFHAIYWPAFLMASGLPMPHHLLVHGWFKVGAQKMSKSFGNVIDPIDLYRHYGADAVRYYLMRQMAVTHDGEFSIDDLEQKISSELADDLGNLLNRMVTLAQKHDLSEIKAPANWQESDIELHEQAKQAITQMQEFMEQCMFHVALNNLWRFINQVNAYFHQHEPWKLAKTDPARFAQVLSATAHSLNAIAIVLWPVMPQKMEQLLTSLGQKLVIETDLINELKTNSWNKTFTMTKIDTLFPKPEPSTESPVVMPPTPIADDAIAIEEFAKVHLTVGTIFECSIIEQSDKLYQLQVDFGSLGKRQILSGIRKAFQSDELIGKQAVFVTNLRPRKMMGLESQGMLLTADNGKGGLSLVAPTQAVPNGTRLK